MPLVIIARHVMRDSAGARRGEISLGRPVTQERGLLALAASAMLGACTPTIRLEVAPIEIYAKLDADVRVRLDRELQDLLAENPNLF